MLCLLRRYGLLLLLLVCPLQVVTAAVSDSATAFNCAIDEEYDAYRKKGDTFFKAGRYGEARQQYQNCLEVPGFERDAYATERIELATKCLQLLQRADEALQNQNDTLLLTTLKQVLFLNPADGTLLNRIVEQYELEGNRQFVGNKLPEAKAAYEQAIGYARRAGNRVRQSTLETQLNVVAARQEQSDSEGSTTLRSRDGGRLPAGKPEQHRVGVKRPVLKASLGIVALGTGVYAYALHRTYSLRKADMERLGDLVDPDRDGLYARVDNLPVDEYLDAIKRAQEAQARRGLYTLCLGVATAALLGETYLLLRPKLKTKSRWSGLFWQPAATEWGLQLGYRF